MEQFLGDSSDFNSKAELYAFFYYASLLTSNAKQIGFQKDYLNYLTGNNRTQEALALYTEIAFNAPTDENLKTLKQLQFQVNPQNSFKDYWSQYINQKGEKTPLLQIAFAEEILDLTRNRDYWVFIDVWGTWCGPCVEELPALQEFFMENKKRSTPILKIYTFCYSSSDCDEFMKEKQFTFPVYEIDKKINDDFDITGYPTKILISPTGNYLKILFNIDWRMYLINYCLLK